MQIPSFLAHAPGAEMAEVANPSDGQPSRGAREFARYLARPAGAGDPVVSETAESGASAERAGEVLPFSAADPAIARGVPEGPKPSDVTLEVASADAPGPARLSVGSAAAFGRDAADVSRAAEAPTEPKLLAQQAQSRPPQTAEPPQVRGRPQAEASPSKATDALPDPGVASDPQSARSSTALDLMRPDARAINGPAGGAGDLAEGHVPVSGGPVAVRPVPPEQAKAPGLARAPGLVGADALPETAVAKGIRETPRAVTGVGAALAEMPLSDGEAAEDTPTPLDAEATGDSDNESRSERSQDRPVATDRSHAAQPAREKVGQSALAVSQVPEMPLEHGAAAGPAEGRISGPSGAPSHPMSPLPASAPAAGLGHAAIQQLSVAVRRSGEGEIEIALEPEELGKVRLTIAPHDTRVTVAVFVERPETLDLIRRHIDALTSDLRQQGYSEVTLDFAQNPDQNGNRAKAVLPQQAAKSDEPVLAGAGPVTPRRPARSGGLDLRL